MTECPGGNACSLPERWLDLTLPEGNVKGVRPPRGGKIHRVEHQRQATSRVYETLACRPDAGIPSAWGQVTALAPFDLADFCSRCWRDW